MKEKPPCHPYLQSCVGPSPALKFEESPFSVSQKYTITIQIYMANTEVPRLPLKFFLDPVIN